MSIIDQATAYALAQTQREEAFKTLLLDAEGALRDGTLDTPARASRSWRELTRGYHEPAPTLTVFEDPHDEIVAVSEIPVWSLCEHHLLPFYGTAHIAYLPNGAILGLSKFARTVDYFARRLQVQERLTTQIADFLEDGLHPRGLAVVLKATHLCMEIRGVQTPGSVTTTSVMRGAFREKPEARAEAMHLMGLA